MASVTQKRKEKIIEVNEIIGHARDSEKGEKMATWDPRIHEIWVDTFIAEIKAKNRQGTTLSRADWKNWVKIFNDATGKDYMKKQLKNHFDTTRKEWLVWNNLVNKESGLGWDPEKKTVVASNEWWEKKLKKYPDAAKFRFKGLEHAFKLDEMYLDVTATGARAWAPTSCLGAPFFKNSGDEDDDGGENDNDSEGENLNDEPIVENKTSVNVGQKRSRKQRKRGKKISASNKLCKSIDRICDVAESRNRTDLLGCSIKEVIDLLITLLECTPLSELYMFGTKLFMKRECREMFMAQPNDEVRLEWLKQEQNDKLASSSH